MKRTTQAMEGRSLPWRGQSVRNTQGQKGQKGEKTTLVVHGAGGIHSPVQQKFAGSPGFPREGESVAEGRDGKKKAPKKEQGRRENRVLRDLTIV